MKRERHGAATRLSAFKTDQVKQRAGAGAVVVDAADTREDSLGVLIENPGKGDARRKAEALIGEKILPVVAKAGRDGEAGVDLVLVLDERACLLLMVNKVHFAGVLIKTRRPVVLVLIRRRGEHGNAV